MEGGRGGKVERRRELMEKKRVKEGRGPGGEYSVRRGGGEDQERELGAREI